MGTFSKVIIQNADKTIAFECKELVGNIFTRDVNCFFNAKANRFGGFEGNLWTYNFHINTVMRTFFVHLVPIRLIDRTVCRILGTITEANHLHLRTNQGRLEYSPRSVPDSGLICAASGQGNSNVMSIFFGIPLL